MYEPTMSKQKKPESCERPHRHRWLWLPAIALATVGIWQFGAQAGWRGGPECGRHGAGGPGKMLMRAVHDLDLTTDQENRLDEIMLEERKQMRAMRKNRTDHHRQMLEIIRAAEVDTAAIDRLTQEHIDAASARIKAHAETMKKVLGILTSEQRRKLADKLERMHERMRDHHGDMREHEEDDD